MPPVPARRFTRAALREECKTLESAVRSQRLVPDEALAAVRPGGDQNRSKNPTMALVRWFGWLQVFLDRGERAGTDAAADPEAIVAAALARRPIRVEGLLPRPAGDRPVWEVHPKGYFACEWLHTKDLLLAWLNGWSHRLITSTSDNAMELLERVALERAYQHGLCCWAVTHPGPWLPFDPSVDPHPEIPDVFRELDPLDVIRIQQAAAQVNASRGGAITRIFAPPTDDGGARGHSWSVFYASLGQKLGVPVGTLMKDYTLVELLVQSGLAAGAEREAYDRAKAQAEHGADATASDAGDGPEDLGEGSR